MSTRTGLAIPRAYFGLGFRVPIVLAAGLLLSGRPVGAQTYTFTQEEFRTLPRYCQAQQFIIRDNRFANVPDSERASWKATLGPDYLFLHHYCRALVYTKRASYSESIRKQKELYRGAIGDFAFTQRNVGADFVLLPEICLRKGFVYRLLGDDSAAAREFSDAIRYKADYTPAYAALVDYFLEIGELQEAERIVTMGVANAPQSQLLKDKRAEIEARRQSSPPDELSASREPRE